MLTFFATAKPFQGHDGIIQRNALKSWTLLHPDVEVILFGNDAGAAEVCAEFGLRHEPHAERHESGAKYLNYMFARAQQISRHEHVCFSNCDIILFRDFLKAFEMTRSWRKKFLLVGQRWDLDVTKPIDFTQSSWDDNLRQLALAKGFLQGPDWIDYFLFSKGQYLDMPALIVGHCHWDHWMIWKALKGSIPVLDASPSVFAIHQNHGYAAEYGRIKGAAPVTDLLSALNMERIGTVEHLRTIADATQRVRPTGIEANRKRYRRVFKHTGQRMALFSRYRIWNPIWFFLLDLTRPLRTALGLRSRKARSSAGTG